MSGMAAWTEQAVGFRVCCADGCHYLTGDLPADLKEGRALWGGGGGGGEGAVSLAFPLD